MLVSRVLQRGKRLLTGNLSSGNSIRKNQVVSCENLRKDG